MYREISAAPDTARDGTVTPCAVSGRTAWTGRVMVQRGGKVECVEDLAILPDRRP